MNTKFSEEAVKEVNEIINRHYRIADRIAELNEKGYVTKQCTNYKGNVGTVKSFKKEIRMQIGYAKTLYYYTDCVIFDKSDGDDEIVRQIMFARNYPHYNLN